MDTVLGIILVGSIYLLPTWVAWIRGRMTAPIFVINLFLGWTLIAWVVALAMAVSSPNQAKPA